MASDEDEDPMVMDMVLDEAKTIHEMFVLELHKNHTEEQVEEIRKVFTMFDKFANLVMAHTNLPTALRALGQLLTEDDVRRLLDEFSEDGKVDFATFCSLVARRPWGMEGSRAELKTTFVNVFHPPKTCWLDRKVFMRTMTTGGEKVTEAEVNQLLELCETKPNGDVNYEAMIDKLLE